MLEELHRFLRGFLHRDASMRALWSDRPNCSHNVSQKVKRIRRVSELRANFVLAKDRKRPYYGYFCGVKCTGRGLVVKRLSKVQALDLVWGVGVFSLLPLTHGSVRANRQRRKRLAFEERSPPINSTPFRSFWESFCEVLL